jgi:hypothetical protein
MSEETVMTVRPFEAVGDPSRRAGRSVLSTLMEAARAAINHAPECVAV